LLCADLETSTPRERLGLAVSVVQQQRLLISRAVERVAGRLPRSFETVIVSGAGEFLARATLAMPRCCPSCPIVSLTAALGAEVSRAACAYAVAILAAEREGSR
jgi:uncharacterized hydantoinase/oxoprolinase family protein